MPESLEPKGGPKLPEHFVKNSERVKYILGKFVDHARDYLADINIDMDEFNERLKSKYPDYHQRALMYIFLGSTLMPGEKYIYDDFPGDDSIEKIIKNLLKKYIVE